MLIYSGIKKMEIYTFFIIYSFTQFFYIGSEAQDVCSGNTFGPECRLTCHCHSDVACDQSTGQCPSFCSRGWHGPNCQMENVALGKRVALKKPHSASLALPAVDYDLQTCFNVSGISSQRLRIDLGSGFKKPIHRIIIFDDLSISHAIRIKQKVGLKVIVSPSKSVGPGETCTPLVQSDVTDKGVYDMNCRSGIVGQYIFVIKKTDPKVLGFCELEAYVCSPFTWGDFCQNTCGYCSNGDTCDKVTGECPQGCTSGWTGCDCKTEQPVPDGSHYCLQDTTTTVTSTQPQSTEPSTKLDTSTDSAITTTQSVTNSNQQSTQPSTEIYTSTDSAIKTQSVTSINQQSTTETTNVASLSATVTTTSNSGLNPVKVSNESSDLGPKSLENSTQIDDANSTTDVTTQMDITVDLTTSDITTNSDVTTAFSSAENSTQQVDTTQQLETTTQQMDNGTEAYLNTTEFDVTAESTNVVNVTESTTLNVTPENTTFVTGNVTFGIENTTMEINQTTLMMDNATSATSTEPVVGMDNMTTEMVTVAMETSATVLISSTMGVMETTTDFGIGGSGSQSSQLTTNTALYIIVPICIVVFVVFITLLGIFFIKRRTKSKKYGIENGVRASVPLLTWNATSEGGYIPNREDVDEGATRFSSFHKDRPITKAIPVSGLQEHISRMHASQQFKSEYESLPKGLAFLCGVGQLDVNIEKNRYKDLIAYDDSRVILLDDNLYSNQDTTDYINAGYIDGFDKEKAYIATQGPKNNTVEDFWRMVWQENSGLIVMLTNLQEGNKIKCFQYWPSEEHNILAGDLTVSLESEIKYPVFVIRKLQLSHNKTEENRTISIYHYTAWPDHGLPDPFQILTFHRAVTHCPTPLDGPMIVHCSAGVGRTGVFIAFDALKQQGKATGHIGILEFVMAMRKKRPNMIQTLDQYIFLYVILLEHFACADAVLHGTSLQSTMSPSATTQFKNRLENEYKALVSMKPKFSQEDYTASLRPENLGKNRDVNILAVDKYRPFLSSTSSNPGAASYINAIVMPSCSRNDGFLVTQIPFKSTILDLWQMVYDYNSNTIVTLDKFDQELEENGIFWPAVGESVVFGPFTITTTSCTDTKDSVAEKMLKLTRKNALDEEEELSIKMLSVDLEQNSQETPKILVQLDSLILSWQSDNGTWPITVMCRDGASHCGLFCAAVNLTDKIDWYNEIDVFHTVRQLHIRRPEIFSSKEQYEKCYQVAKTYMDAADTYRNHQLEVRQSRIVV